MKGCADTTPRLITAIARILNWAGLIAALTIGTANTRSNWPLRCTTSAQRNGAVAGPVAVSNGGSLTEKVSKAAAFTPRLPRVGKKQRGDWPMSEQKDIHALIDSLEGFEELKVEQLERILMDEQTRVIVQ